jgi:hypothetical protein
MEQIGTNIRRKEAVGHSLYPPTCGKSLAACLPQDTTRLSAECKDCGGDEVAGLTRKRVCVPPLAASCCVMRARAKNFLSGLEGRVGRSAGRRSTPYGKDEDQLGYLVPCSSSIDMLPRVTLLSACSHLNQSFSSARTAFSHAGAVTFRQM